MSNLGKSIVRGFGFAIGNQLAKSLMSTRINPDSRLFGISTKRQWYSLGLWLLTFATIPFIGGKEYGPTLAVINLILGAPFQILIQYFLQKNDDRKQNKEYHNECMVQYQNALTLAKNENVDVSELIVKDTTFSYNLSKFSNLITNKVNRTIQFRAKYYGEDLKNIVEQKVWLGMSIENITDMFGKPTQIEVEENSRSKYETLIYGPNKRSGDVYTFRNGLLKEYKDR